MSRFIYRNILIVVALFLAGLTLPAGAAAKDRPFKARQTGNASLTPTEDPCIWRNDETGEGNATHLGRFTWRSVERVDFCTVEGGVAVVGTFTMTAANGDKLAGTYQTIGLVNEEGNLIIHGQFQITGGTGRFDDATGGGDLDAVASLAPGLPFEGSMNGRIDY